jgi:nucleoside-diphosphate-sugar epimerase
VSGRVLVTGAAGFIGRYLVPLLAAAGHEVHALSRTVRPGELDGAATWHEVDLLVPGASRRVLEKVRPARLVHLAWCTEHGAYWESPANVAWVQATLSLLREFAASGGQRAVCAGTCAEYSWDRSPCVEQVTPLEPATFYGVCKDATRRVSAGLADRAPFTLAWARPFLLYGPGEDERRLIPHVARALLAGEPAEVGDGSIVRDFLHVEDVARAFAAVLDSEIRGPVNIASGVPVTLRRVVEMVSRAAGAPELVRFGAFPRRPGDPAELVGSADRLSEEAGFQPLIPLDEGIAQTVQWWRGRLADG